MGREGPGLSFRAPGGALSILRSTPGWVAALILASEPQFPVCKVRGLPSSRVKGLCLPGNRVEPGSLISLLVQSVVKNPPSSAGTRVPSPVWEIRAQASEQLSRWATARESVCYPAWTQPRSACHS